MNDDWRSRNTLTAREALKIAGAILGLLFACILLMWILTKAFHHSPEPPPPTAEK